MRRWIWSLSTSSVHLHFKDVNSVSAGDVAQDGLYGIGEGLQSLDFTLSVLIQLQRLCAAV